METRRILYFVLGALSAALVFVFALAGVAHFVPRFLDYSRDSDHRFVIIIAAAVILLMNILRRHQRRRKAKAPSRMNLTNS
ncbi:MAG TPA: hypothetical protein VGN17_08725 [Bryobacteraceae bacterium]|jgi:membrane protein DedA with SNARE-associated domain